MRPTHATKNAKQHFLKDHTIPVISDPDKQALETPLTIEEITEAAKPQIPW
jgi:hypothetical protein